MIEKNKVEYLIQSNIYSMGLKHKKNYFRQKDSIVLNDLN